MGNDDLSIVRSGVVDCLAGYRGSISKSRSRNGVCFFLVSKCLTPPLASPRAKNHEIKKLDFAVLLDFDNAGENRAPALPHSLSVRKLNEQEISSSI